MHVHNLSYHKRRVSTDWVANIIGWKRPLNTCYMISKRAGTILRGVYTQYIVLFSPTLGLRGLKSVIDAEQDLL